MKYSQEEKRLRLSHHTGSKQSPAAFLGVDTSEVGKILKAHVPCVPKWIGWEGFFLHCQMPRRLLAWPGQGGLGSIINLSSVTLLVIRRS